MSYRPIVNSLTIAADGSIPMLSCNSSKPYWSAELQELKNDSIQAHLAWEAVGKPRQGLLNNLRLQAKTKYKLAIKNAAFLFENDAHDDLSNLYLRKNFNKFWKKWHIRFSKRNTNPPHVNGNTDKHAIAECFNEYFLASGFDSYADTSKVVELNNLMSKNDCTKKNNVFTVSDVEKALAVLKSGKAAGFDGIV